MPLTITSAKLNYIEALSVLAVFKGIDFAAYNVNLIPYNLFTETMQSVYTILKASGVAKSKVGVYTVNQFDAAALAFAMGAVQHSAFDTAKAAGYYPHYHDLEHTIHIWFGASL